MNINGRVCLYFGIFWGILGLWLIQKVNPKVDTIIDRWKNKISDARQKTFVSTANALLLIDCIVSVFALEYYQVRVVVENQIPVKDYERYEARYEEIYSNEKRKHFIETCWGNETMIKTFPNLKVIDKDGNNVYLDSFYPEIQNYYYKLFDNEVKNLREGEI